MSVEGEIVSIFKIISEIILLFRVQKRIYIIEIEGKLSKTIEKRSHFGRCLAGGSGKVSIVGSTLANDDLGVLKHVRGVFTLKQNSLPEDRTQPLAQAKLNIAVSQVIIYAGPMLGGAWFELYSISLLESS